LSGAGNLAGKGKITREEKEKGEWFMKSLMVIMLLVVAVPAMAVVNFTASDAGGGKLLIAYTSPEGDAPRGVALRISLTAGAVVDFAAPIEVDGAFNAYIDYAYSNPLTFNLDAGKGHPLAKATEAGALIADAADFSISMGVLDQTGAQLAGPVTTAKLIKLQLKGTADPTVTITGDTLRGPASGVVGSVLTSNLPQTTVVKFGPIDCYTGPDTADWVAVGKPDSWCTPRQCHGDANNATEVIGKGSFWVGYNDINILLLGFKQAYAGNPATQTWIAADFDHKTEVIGKGTFRVGYNDINVLLKYFKGAAVPTDCLSATPVKP